MTESTKRQSSWSRRRQQPLVEAALEDLAAVDVGEKALKEARGAALFARFEAGNGAEHAEKLRSARRQLRGERARLRQMRAIAAIVALAHVDHRHAFGRIGIRRVDQA